MSRDYVPVVALAGLFVVSLMVYGLLAHSHSIPSVFPDEFIYGNVAKGIANGDGPTWRGQGMGIPLLYPYVISPAFLGGSVVHGYLIAKLIGVLLVSLTVLPVWLLGRDLVGARTALVPAVLTVAGSWMLYSQELVSETLALPIASGALCAAVAALRRPGGGWIWVALGLAAAGAYARVMLIVLFPILAAALLLDVVRQPRNARRARLRANRIPLGLLGVLLAGGVSALLLLGVSHIGLYDVTPDELDAHGLFKGFVNHQLLIITMVGTLPATAALALALRRANWRDDTCGPFLCVLGPAVFGLAALAGWFIEGNRIPWPVQRYVIYAGPLLLLALVLVPGRVPRRLALAVSPIIPLLLLAAPAPRQVLEQAALFGEARRLGSIVDAFSYTRHPALGFALVGLLVSVGGMWALSRSSRSGSGILMAGALVLVVLVAQVQATEHYQLDFIHRARAATFPAHLDWVDRRAGPPVGLVNQEESAAYDRASGRLLTRIMYWTEFFNRDIKAVYLTQDVTREYAGPSCPWAFDSQGRLTAAVVGCHRVPPVLLLTDGPFQTHFSAERIVAEHAGLGRMVEVRPPPRALAFVRSPCFGSACRGTLPVVLFLERPGVLRGWVRGRGGVYEVQVGTEPPKLVRAGAVQQLTVPVPAGPTVQQLEFNGQGPFPDVHLFVHESGATTRIY